MDQRVLSRNAALARVKRLVVRRRTFLAQGCPAIEPAETGPPPTMGWRPADELPAGVADNFRSLHGSFIRQRLPLVARTRWGTRGTRRRVTFGGIKSVLDHHDVRRSGVSEMALGNRHGGRFCGLGELVLLVVLAAGHLRSMPIRLSRSTVVIGGLNVWGPRFGLVSGWPWRFRPWQSSRSRWLRQYLAGRVTARRLGVTRPATFKSFAWAFRPCSSASPWRPFIVVVG